jgi:hypothetical protein
MKPEQEARIIKNLVELEDLKMKLVRDCNFTDASAVRESQKIMRELLRQNEINRLNKEL